MLGRTVKLLIVLAVVLGWFYASLPQLMLLTMGPYVIVNNFVGGSVELTLLVFDGWAAALWLMIRPLMIADNAVRKANERTRQKWDARD